MIPKPKVGALWKNHVLASLESKRNYFFDEARKRAFSDINPLWNQYKADVLARSQ